MTTTQKTIKVKVDNTSVMNSIENASVSVTSPTGKTIRLYKRHLCKKATPEMVAVFWKCANDPMTAFIGDIELTVEEMQTAFEMSKL